MAKIQNIRVHFKHHEKEGPLCGATKVQPHNVTSQVADVTCWGCIAQLKRERWT